MFHVEDDFDFDDDLLDATGSDNSSKLEDEGSNSLERNNSTPLRTLTNVQSQFLDNNVKQVNTVSEVEFLNLWEAQNENTNHRTLNISLPSISDLSTRHVRKTVRQRKFPGPAGLLPERQGNTSLIATDEFLDELNSENNESLNFKEKDILSQRSESVFESGAWGALMEDLGISGRSLISLMNLASLRLKHTRGYKVPFLAVIINNIDCTLPDPTVVVKDPTDEMHGMLHREVWEKFNTDMIPGSVLVLKNVGVISAGTTSRRHVLNITSNNLTAIYTISQEDDVQVRRISELPSGDNSRTLAEEWERLVSSPLPSEKISRNTPTFSKSLGKRNGKSYNTFNSPTSSTIQTPQVKQSFSRRQLMKGQSVAKSLANNASVVEQQPFKRRKNIPPVDEVNVKGNKKQSNLLPTQNSAFKVDSDTSLVDTLLDGIDTDSLFEEF